MTRREFLQARMVYDIGEALARVSRIPVTDRAITCPAIDLREPENPAMSSNGGDYHRWLNCRQYTPGVFIVEEDWSADWDIADYSHMEGIIVLTQQEVRELISLPLDE